MRNKSCITHESKQWPICHEKNWDLNMQKPGSGQGKYSNNWTMTYWEVHHSLPFLYVFIYFCLVLWGDAGLICFWWLCPYWEKENKWLALALCGWRVGWRDWRGAGECFLYQAWFPRLNYIWICLSWFLHYYTKQAKKKKKDRVFKHRITRFSVL